MRRDWKPKRSAEGCKAWQSNGKCRNGRLQTESTKRRTPHLNHRRSEWPTNFWLANREIEHGSGQGELEARTACLRQARRLFSLVAEVNHQHLARVTGMTKDQIFLPPRFSGVLSQTPSPQQVPSLPTVMGERSEDAWFFSQVYHHGRRG